MNAPRTRRYAPSFWVWLPILILAAVVGWFKLGRGTGDAGMDNAICYIAVAIGLMILSVWLVAFSAYNRAVRFGYLGTMTAAALFVAFGVQVDGWTGSMVPRLSFPWSNRTASDLAAGTSIAGEAAAVDLVTTTPHDFPGFLGATRTAEVTGVTLAPTWQKSPPVELWRADVGAAWSGFAIVNGVAVTHEQRGADEVVVARELLTGKELWRHAHPTSFDHQLGGAGPRATPLIEGGRVYAQGARGYLVCLDGATGKVLWDRDLLEMQGVTIEQEDKEIAFGRSGSPLVYKDMLIMPVGGNLDDKRAGLVAFDKITGDVRWKGPPRQISHASPNIATLADVTQLLVTNQDTLSGHDPETGRLLWEFPWPGRTGADANNSQPLPVPPDSVLASKGYGQGSALYRLESDGEGGLRATERWSSRRALRTKLTNAVVHGKHAFALSDGILECVSLAEGERLWRDGRYGHGQVLLVGDLLLVLSEDGELLLVEASAERENNVLGRVQALDGKTWNTFALYDHVVVVRNAHEAAAFRLP